MRLLVPWLTIAAISAQTTVVSPASAGAAEGSTYGTVPFVAGGPFRYLQMHGDLGQSPMLLQRIAFRRDTAAAGSGTLSTDLELHVGPANRFDQPSWYLSRNYAGAQTKVIARKVVVLGPAQGAGTPAPFDVKLLLDAPYPFLGGAPAFAWEVIVYSASSTGTFPLLDAVGSQATAGTAPVGTGSGCWAQPATWAMDHNVVLADVGGTLTLGGYVTYGPSNAPTLLALGASNPATVVPGLCAPLYTDLAITLPIGTTGIYGYLGAPGTNGQPAFGGGYALAVPNALPGAKVYLQAHSADALSAYPIQIASSSGLAVTVPAVTPGQPEPVTRLYNTYPQFESAICAPLTNVGTGLVVEFMY